MKKILRVCGVFVMGSVSGMQMQTERSISVPTQLPSQKSDQATSSPRRSVSAPVTAKERVCNLSRRYEDDCYGTFGLENWKLDIRSSLKSAGTLLESGKKVVDIGSVVVDIDEGHYTLLSDVLSISDKTSVFKDMWRQDNRREAGRYLTSCCEEFKLIRQTIDEKQEVVHCFADGIAQTDTAALLVFLPDMAED